MIREENIVEFYDCTTNKKQIKKGLKAGNNLIIGRIGEIYQLYRYDGKLFCDLKFENLEDTIKFAEWIDIIYSEYFLLFSEYPDINLPQLTQYTIQHGQEFCNMFRTLQSLNRSITWKDVEPYYVNLSRARN